MALPIDRELALSYIVDNGEPEDITQTHATTVDLSQVAKLQAECDRIIQNAIPSIAIQYVEEGSYTQIPVPTCMMLAKSGHCHLLLEQFEKMRRQNVSLSPEEAFEYSLTLLNNVASIHGIIESDLFLEVIQWLFVHVDSKGVEILVHSLRILPIQAKSKIELLDQLREVVLKSRQHNQCERCENYHVNWPLLISIDDLRFHLLLSISQFEVLVELMRWYSFQIYQEKLGLNYVAVSHDQWCSQFVSISLEKEKYKQAVEIANLFPRAAQFWIDNLRMGKVRLKGVVEAVSTINDAFQRNSIFLDLVKNGFAVWDCREDDRLELLNQLRLLVLNKIDILDGELYENEQLLLSIDDQLAKNLLSNSNFDYCFSLLNWYFNKRDSFFHSLAPMIVEQHFNRWCTDFAVAMIRSKKIDGATKIGELFPYPEQFWLSLIRRGRVSLGDVICVVSVMNPQSKNRVLYHLLLNGFPIWQFSNEELPEDDEILCEDIRFFRSLYENLIEDRGNTLCVQESHQNTTSSIRQRRRRTSDESHIKSEGFGNSMVGFDQMLSQIHQISCSDRTRRDFYIDECWKTLVNNEGHTILACLAINGDARVIQFLAEERYLGNLGDIDKAVGLARQNAHYAVVEFLLEYKFDTLLGEENIQKSPFSYRQWLLGLSLYFIQKKQYESAIRLIRDMRPEDRLHAACVMKERLATSAEQSRSIHDLPPELLTECLAYVEPLMPVTNVCRKWRDLVQNSSALRSKWQGEQKILGHLETLIENDWHEFARNYLTPWLNHNGLDGKSLAIIHLPTIFGNLLSAEHYIWAKTCLEIYFFETDHHIRQEIIDEVCAHAVVCEDQSRIDWLLMRALELIPREDEELMCAIQQEWPNLTDLAGKYTTFPLGSLSKDSLPPQNIDPEVSVLEDCFSRLIELMRVDEGGAVIHLHTTLKAEFENTKSDWEEQGQVVAQRLRPMIKRWVLRLICHERAHLAVLLVEFLELDLIDRLIIRLLMKSVLRYGRYRN